MLLLYFNSFSHNFKDKGASITISIFSDTLVVIMMAQLQLSSHSRSFFFIAILLISHVKSMTVQRNSEIKRSITHFSSALPTIAVAALVLTQSQRAAATTTITTATATIKLPKDAYNTLGDLTYCRLLSGMWQVSGAHGYVPDKDKAISEMLHCADEGFSTFDLADIYGPAEEYVGGFKRGKKTSSVAKNCQFFTKWVPQPGEVDISSTTAAIDRSLRRMQSDSIDLLQFNWFPYQNKNYFQAVDHLVSLKQAGKIKNIGLTNFDTEHMEGLMRRGAPIVSNQISYSVLDTRPKQKMESFCKENNVQLLVYGTLLVSSIVPTLDDCSHNCLISFS